MLEEMLDSDAQRRARRGGPSPGVAWLLLRSRGPKTTDLENRCSTCSPELASS